ncbi:LysR family transcriptional regulator [Verminephrobacter aporrectodeae subsp. tuberculatae]|uniref:LysR family transcriptional regulator n=1 Tax=Verminephrobacter aporrectodeae TaxID=1110389 RepID=UPI0022376D04|nr:LysR family transcriptional regulator [Verminephrobacter aporrectodeae]MCW5254875.1 LysR family transcriptional regulator [Verminephrobacter aporrectodeae subsp. tuberculatae]
MGLLNFRSLDLNLLRVFDEVMAQRSLTRAAHRLSLSQPAVSNAMRRLREVLGDELLVRSGQGVEPTPRALALWPPVREALTQLQESLAPGHFDPATAESTLVLAMADATAATLVPALVESIEREAPGVSVRVLPLTTRDPRRLLDEQAADMAIGHFPAVLADLTARAQSGGGLAFESRRLYDGEYTCVMRQDHPLAHAPLTLDAYCAARHMLVSFSGRPFGFIDEALASLGRKRKVVITVNQFFTAARVVSGSDLLTVLPRHFVPVTGLADVLAQRALPLDVPPVHVDALWRRNGPQQSAVNWLLHALARCVRQIFPQQPGS